MVSDALHSAWQMLEERELDVILGVPGKTTRYHRACRNKATWLEPAVIPGLYKCNRLIGAQSHSQ